jgi:transcription antitermination factor NusG
MRTDTPHWYAAATTSRHEKVAADFLHRFGIENYLPINREVHQWSDRKVTVGVPLFPGYVFVRIMPPQRLSVLRAPGIARLVGVHGYPAPLNDNEIEGIRRYLAEGFPAEPYDAIPVGCWVRVINGPLAGVEGRIVRRKGLKHFVMTVALVSRSVRLDVSAWDVARIQNPTVR